MDNVKLENSFQTKNAGQLLIFHHNMRSLKSCLDELSVFLHTLVSLTDILVVNEILFSLIAMYNIDGSVPSHVYRADKRCSGLFVYVRKDGYDSPITYSKFGNCIFEWCLVRITLEPGSCLCALEIFRPPDRVVLAEFKPVVSDVVLAHFHPSDKVLLIDDFNTDAWIC